MFLGSSSTVLVFNRLVGIVVFMIAGLVGFTQISFLLFETGVVLWDMLAQFCLFRYGLTARFYVWFFVARIRVIMDTTGERRGI